MQRDHTKLDTLITLINGMAFDSAKVLVDDITAKYGEKQTGAVKFQEVLVEFLFFYVHQVSRAAQNNLEIEKATHLLQKILPTLAEKNRFFQEKDADLVIFKAIYNDAESDYSKCSALIVKGEPFSDRAFQSVLVKRILKKLDPDFGDQKLTERDLDIIKKIMTVSTDIIVKYWSNQAMDHYLLGLSNEI